MEEFLEFLGFSFSDEQPLKDWHSLYLRTERYMIPSDSATLAD